MVPFLAVQSPAIECLLGKSSIKHGVKAILLGLEIAVFYRSALLLSLLKAPWPSQAGLVFHLEDRSRPDKAESDYFASVPNKSASPTPAEGSFFRAF